MAGKLKVPLTKDFLDKMLRYDSETGLFTWLIGGGCAKTGSIAGSTCGYGYTVISIKKRVYKAHRLAWLTTYGVFPSDEIDHINGDKKDNRLANLREVDGAANRQNAAMSRCNTSGFSGAVLNKKTGRYMAQIKVGNKSRYLGTFDTPQEAHEAYIAAKKQLHPGFVAIRAPGEISPSEIKRSITDKIKRQRSRITAPSTPTPASGEKS